MVSKPINPMFTGSSPCRQSLSRYVSHHVLHTDADLPIAVKGSIEAHNVGGVAFMQHLQLSDNLVSDGRLDFKVDQLSGKRMRP